MAGKKFAAEFALRRNVSALDKILIQDSDDDVVKYAYPPQIAALSGYAYAKSIADLPLMPSNKSIGYIVGQMLYIYVGMGGDTKDGLYQSVGFFVGPQGVQGEKGEQGEQGEQGIQGPKGDNGGLSLQELDEYLATKQYVTGDTLAEMLAGYVSNTSLMRDYVTIAKTQDVTGVKNFTAGLQFGGVPMYKSKGDTVFLDGNLVVRGGVTAFGTNETITASIFEALPIDGTTIKRDPITKELYVDTNVVGGGGSGGGSVDPSQLEAYLKPYAKTADVASTYATIASLSAVTSRLNDFLSGSDTDTIINKWSELETFLAGLAETDDLATILSGKANKATTLAGYGITDAYTKSHIDSNFVTIGTKQEITGEKDFVGGFKVNGGLVEYNATLKAWVLNGDLLVTGGVSAFSNISGFKPSTIMEAVLIDNKTIKRNADGFLYAVPQGAGGINEDQLADYLTTNGYATQSWVTSNGYITASALEPYALKTAIPTNTNQLTNGAGFISGITSSMVTGALGYTPLDKQGVAFDSNKFGGLSVADFARVKQNVSDFDANNMPDGVWGGKLFGSPNWALYYYAYLSVGSGNYKMQFNGVGNRLTYRAGNESGIENKDWVEILSSANYSNYALPKDGTAAAADRLVEEVVTDLNNATAGRIFTMTSGYGSTAGNKPTKYWVTGLTLAYAQNSSFRRQLAFTDAIDESLYLRAEHIGVWGEWSKVLTSSNFYDYALPITGGKISGDLEVSGCLYSSVGNLRIKSKVAPMAGVEIAVSDTDYWQISHRGSFANNELHFYHNANGTWSNSVLSLISDGSVIVGNNLLAKGGVTATNSSDERLKRNLRKFNASKVLMSLGGVYEYEYVDSEVQKNHIYEGTHYGLIYQHVKGTKLDVMCHEREDGMGALNYIHPKFISLIAGATMENISEVEKLKRKVRHLEAKVKQLEQKA